MNIQRRIAEDNHPHLERSPRGRLNTGAPNPVDVHVGRQLRLRRVMLGMSQERLAEAIGVTFQQIQKYERGANRISASRLWDLSVILGRSVDFFYKDMDASVAGASPRNLSRGETPETILEPSVSDENEQMYNRETLNLLRAYHAIKDPHVRRRICDLAKSLATLMEDGIALPDERSDVADETAAAIPQNAGAAIRPAVNTQ
jgi:transcriptional regulator with XRE-family HTH domain